MRVLVLGAAVSGLAAAKLAHDLGYRVTVYDQEPESLAPLLARGIATVSGRWHGDLLEAIDLVVTSPGFSERSAPIVETLERRLPLVSEVEFAWARLDCPIIAVTGTNGKTTVTEVTARMLGASGVKAMALGNIGAALSDAVGSPPEVAVVEVSSFQLRFIDAFKPEVAVVVNVAPDHLDWHGSYDSYWSAKARIVENQDAGDVVVFDQDDEGASRIASRSAGKRIAFSSVAAGAATLAHGNLDLPGLRLSVDELKVRDRAFVSDLGMAGLAALEMGATAEAIRNVATSFSPGRHRRTVVGSAGGVTYVDDSKATNPHAALAAIESFPSVVLIAGGLAKGLDVRPLAAAPNVRAVVAIGEAAPELLEAAADRGVAASSIEEAVELATSRAQPGDVVLLAPGCASFDMFRDYGHRGDAFSEAVSTIIGART